MPIPKPRRKEKEKDFISRCMGDTVMVKDYPENKQRAAVCYDSWKRTKKEQAAEDRDLTPFIEQDIFKRLSELD